MATCDDNCHTSNPNLSYLLHLIILWLRVGKNVQSSITYFNEICKYDRRGITITITLRMSLYKPYSRTQTHTHTQTLSGTHLCIQTRKHTHAHTHTHTKHSNKDIAGDNTEMVLLFLWWSRRRLPGHRPARRFPLRQHFPSL